MSRSVVVTVSAALLLALGAAGARGASVREMVRDANRYYERGEYDKAITLYREVLERDPELRLADYNLGNALHMRDELEPALERYQESLGLTDSLSRAKVQYNMGNTYLKEGRYDEAITSFVEALKLDPGDADAKHNLELALREKEQQKQQEQQKKDDQQEKQDSQDQDRDQNQERRQEGRQGDQDEEQRQDQDQEGEGDRERGQQAPSEGEEDRDVRSPEEGETRPAELRGMTKEEALRILKALQEEEQKLREMLLRRDRQKRSRGKKDW